MAVNTAGGWTAFALATPPLHCSVLGCDKQQYVSGGSGNHITLSPWELGVPSNTVRDCIAAAKGTAASVPSASTASNASMESGTSSSSNSSSHSPASAQAGPPTPVMKTGVAHHGHHARGGGRSRRRAAAGSSRRGGQKTRVVAVATTTTTMHADTAAAPAAPPEDSRVGWSPPPPPRHTIQSIPLWPRGGAAALSSHAACTAVSSGAHKHVPPGCVACCTCHQIAHVDEMFVVPLGSARGAAEPTNTNGTASAPAPATGAALLKHRYMCANCVSPCEWCGQTLPVDTSDAHMCSSRDTWWQQYCATVMSTLEHDADASVTPAPAPRHDAAARPMAAAADSHEAAPTETHPAWVAQLLPRTASVTAGMHLAADASAPHDPWQTTNSTPHEDMVVLAAAAASPPEAPQAHQAAKRARYTGGEEEQASQLLGIV